jgi:hypothetical protein
MMLRISLTCLVLTVMVLLLPFAVAKVLAGILGFLFVIFLVAGLSAVDNLAA